MIWDLPGISKKNFASVSTSLLLLLTSLALNKLSLVACYSFSSWLENSVPLESSLCLPDQGELIAIRCAFSLGEKGSDI